MSRSPETKICNLVFLCTDTRVLLAMKKRGFGAGLWNGLGGKVDPGETIEQSAVRECQEEGGVTPLELDKVAIHKFIFTDGTPTMEVHTYLSQVWQGTPTETEEMAPKWFDKTAIPYNDMWQDDLVWLPQVLDGKKLRTQFVFDGQQRLQRAELTFVDSLDDFPETRGVATLPT